MATRLQSLIYKTVKFIFNPATTTVYFYLVVNCSRGYTAPPAEWDYSLGSKEKFSKPIYTPLKKMESEVLYYPIPGGEKPATESPLGRDYYTYIVPKEVFGIKTIEVEITMAGMRKALEEIKAEELAKEIEEAMPIIMQAALKKKEETGLEHQQYLLRVKRHKETTSIASREQQPAGASEERTKETHQKKVPSENEIDILVNIIFGQGKVIIKIPPLKDSKEKERLLKELERLAQIMVRQEELLDIEHISR